MIGKALKIMPILSSSSMDDTEDLITFVVILAFITFVGIPLFQWLFGKKDDDK